eukprot:7297563-Alexandrium_andersonii.AAC.1
MQWAVRVRVGCLPVRVGVWHGAMRTSLRNSGAQVGKVARSSSTHAHRADLARCAIGHVRKCSMHVCIMR